MQPSGWYTPTQVARELEISVEYVRQLLRQGRIEHSTTPLGRLISNESLEAARTQGYGKLRGKSKS